MDLSKLKDRGIYLIKKYKFVLLILSIGLVLILMPTDTKSDQNDSPLNTAKEQSHISEEALSKILKKINGAGRVEVLLSMEYSEQKDYQLDVDYSTSSTDKQKTVTVTDSQRNETGLIRKIYAPVYRGAIVVCDGADDPNVQLSVIQAVANLTGLRSDQISVLKMQ